MGQSEKKYGILSKTKELSLAEESSFVNHTSIFFILFITFGINSLLRGYSEKVISAPASFSISSTTFS